MGLLVCGGAQLTCSFGAAPGALTVTPQCRVLAGMPAASVMDMKPLVNIAPFAMCSSPVNPAVISATAAALGVPTPAPCVPAPAGPWVPGSPNTLVGGLPALNSACTVACAWGGVITIPYPGQTTVTA